MKKKIFGGLFVLAIAAVAAFNMNINTQDSELSLLGLANVEVLAYGDPSDEYKCALKKDDCVIRIGSYVQLSALIRKGYLSASASVGDEVDLTDMTKIYSAHFWPWDNKVRCGTDVTCYDITKTN